MAGLLDIFGTGGTQSLGLLGMSPESIQGSRDDAQAQALYALAGRLFQGGNTGASIAEGLQQGQKLYSSAMQNQLQQQMQGFQMKDLLEKRKREQEAEARQAMANRLLPSLMQRGQAAVPAQMVEKDGRYMGETPTVAAQAGGINQDVLDALSRSPEGQKALLNFANLQKALSGEVTKVGKNEQLVRINPLTQVQEVLAGAAKQERPQGNPFDLFANDIAVPAALRATAQRYQKSYAAGNLDEETADKRFSELANRIQSSEQFQQNQQALADQRRQTNLLAQGQQALAQNMAGVREAEIQQRMQTKQEEMQKPVTEAKEAISLINQAETLLDTATGSLTGTGVDVLAGAFGKSTQGAKSSAQLKAIQGALVAKMPKMSGPQSDKDVLLYREMAAQVGDSTLPTDTRRAALETLREIQERYAKVEPGSSKPAAPTSPFKFDAAKENRYQQWLKTQEKK